MSCPACFSEAVVATGMRNAPVVPVWTCSSCGKRWSNAQCETRRCTDYAVAQCVECGQYRCEGHGPGKSGVCAACVRRIAVPRAPRQGSWRRTGKLYE